MLGDAVRALEGTSLSQLQMILQHEAAYELFLHSITTVQQMEKSAEATEDVLLETEPATQEAQKELESFKAEADALDRTISAKLTELSESQSRRAETLARLNARQIKVKMEEAVVEQEALSEETLASFLDGGVKPQEFISQYTNHRKAVHTSSRKCQDGSGVAEHLVAVVRG